MSDQKTLPTTQNVTAYINAIDDPIRKADCFKLAEMMTEITAKPGVLWGNSIIGFDQYNYKSSSRQGIWMRVGFAHRVGPISLYGITQFPDAETYLAKLGKYKMGKGCLYVKKLTDVDLSVLKEMILQGYLDNKRTNPDK